MNSPGTRSCRAPSSILTPQDPSHRAGRLGGSSRPVGRKPNRRRNATRLPHAEREPLGQGRGASDALVVPFGRSSAGFAELLRDALLRSARTALSLSWGLRPPSPEAAPAASPRAALSGQVQQNFCPAALARRIHDAISADGRDRSEKGARRIAGPRRTVRTPQVRGAPYVLRSKWIGSSEWSRRE